ncbi:MAG: histidine--tRNA ligase [Abditibacteriales bacterium]|nr:histidine--tRNA ligase [Abditibacteriales bacterium]MDW8364696.1 histidine--tRNA ligase [Abditibacteriales bacterium]
MRYQAPRGTHDVLPSEVPNWRFVEETFRELCARYGYQEIRTPVFEVTELFARTSGESSDIVTKQMYTFRVGDESLTLRPEGTAPTIRAYLEHALHAQGPVCKLFYICPIFRHEAPQAGRYRQHHQVGIECLGAADAAADAEVIALGHDYLRALGITGEVLHLNSVGCPQCRPTYRQALRDFLQPLLPRLCDDCQRRYAVNPLRVLDCKSTTCKALVADAPRGLDYLCAECAAHFAQVRRWLDTLGIGYELDPRLVRGLDYYTRTAFEFMHDGLGAQSTVIGGGRYDGLIEQCGGKPTPGVGFGSGIERALLIRAALQAALPAAPARKVFVATQGDAARAASIPLLYELRRAKVPAETDYLGRSLKAQMREAHRQGARFALILGDDELAHNVVTLRDLQTHEQRVVPREQVVSELQRLTAV